MRQISLLFCGLALATQANDLKHFMEVAREIPAARAEAKAAGVPMHTRDLAPPALKPEDNAAPILKAAQEQMRGKSPSKDIVILARSEKAEERAEAQKLMEEFDATLNNVVAATRLPGINFGRTWDTDEPWDLLFPEFAMLRSQAKWLVARSSLRAKAGEFTPALNDCRAAFTLGRFAASDPTIISLLVAIAIDAIAARNLEVMATTNWNDAQHLASMRVLVAEQRLQPNLWHYLRGEAAMGIAASEKWAAGKDDEVRALSMGEELPNMPKDVPADLVGRAFLTRTLQFWTQVSKITKEKKSEVEQADALNKLEEEVNISGDLTQTLIRYMSPVLSQSATASAVRVARLRTVDALLSVLQYKQKFGKLPETLLETGFEDLDPFTQKPLLYRVEGEAFLVWSVGADKVDDLGEEKSIKDLVARFPRK